MEFRFWIPHLWEESRDVIFLYFLFLFFGLIFIHDSREDGLEFKLSDWLQPMQPMLNLLSELQELSDRFFQTMREITLIVSHLMLKGHYEVGYNYNANKVHHYYDDGPP